MRRHHLFVVLFFVAAPLIALAQGKPPGPAKPPAKPAEAPAAEAPKAETRPAPPAAPEKKEVDELHVLFTSDIYGRYAWPGCGKRTPGKADLSHMVTTVNLRRMELRKAGLGEPLVLAGGSMVRPDVMGNHIWGAGNAWAPMAVQLFKKIGFHAVAVGPYDFGAHPEVLQRYMSMMRKADLPLLSANVLCKDKKDFRCQYLGHKGRRYVLLQRKDLRVAIFSVTREDMTKRIVGEAKGSMDVKDPVETTVKMVKMLRQQEKADVVILLANMNVQGNSPQAVVEFVRKLGTTAPDLVVADAMFDQSSGNFIRKIGRQSGPPIVGTDRFGQHVGQAIIHFSRKEGRAAVRRIDVSMIDVAREPPDPKSEPLVADMLKELCRVTNEPLGKAHIKGSLSLADFRTYMMQMMRTRVSAEIAVLNDSSIADTSFPMKGTITRENILRAIRTETHLGHFRMSGSTLIKKLALPYVVKKKPGLQVLGITKKGKKYYINNRLIQNGHHYKVATTAFVAGGGDGLFSLWAETFHDSGFSLRRATLDFFEDGGPARNDGDHSVDLETDFPDLYKKWLLFSGMNAGVFLTNVSVKNGGDDAPYNKPLITREDQTTLKITGDVALGASNRDHAVEADVNLKYAHTWTEDGSAEAADQIRLDFLYRLTYFRNKKVPAMWYMPVPFAQATLNTEFTGDSTYCPKPDDESCNADEEDTYHYLDVRGMLGAGVLINPSLFVKAGFAVTGELLTPARALKDQGIDAGRVGAYLGYKLRRRKLNSSIRNPILLESRLDFFMTDFSESFQRELTWETKLFFNFLPMFYVSASYRMYVFAAAKDSVTESSMAHDISIGFEILTDYRHQLF